MTPALNSPQAHPEMQPDLALLEARDDVHRAMIIEYRKLAGIAVNSHIDKLLREAYANPAKLEEMIHMRKTTFSERTEKTAETFTAALEGIEGRLQTALGPKSSSLIIPMVDGIKKPITKKSIGKHRYAHVDGGVDFKHIEEDRKMLRTYINAFPQAAQDLEQIDHALDTLRKQDDRYEIREFQNIRGQNRFDATINGMLKPAAVLALGVMALAGGAPAIIELIKTGKTDGKQVLGSALFLAVAGLIANPRLRQDLLASADQKTIADIHTTLNNPAFRRLTDEYDIRGDEWARIAQKIMDKPADTNAYLAKVRSNGNRHEGLEKETEKLVRALTRSEKEAQTLHRMIEENRFVDLAHMLSFTSTPAGRAVIMDYIKIGAQPFMNNAHDAAGQINRANPR